MIPITKDYQILVDDNCLTICKRSRSRDKKSKKMVDYWRPTWFYTTWYSLFHAVFNRGILAIDLPQDAKWMEKNIKMHQAWMEKMVGGPISDEFKAGGKNITKNQPLAVGAK